MKFNKQILRNKRVLIGGPVLVALVVLIGIGFYHTDEFGLTPWEKGQDILVSDDWVGWIRPFGQEGRALKVGPFDTVQNCQAYAFDHLRREYDTWKDAEYSCGYRCGLGEYPQNENDCRLVRK